MLLAIMAVAVAISFSAPSFAGDEKKDKKDEKKGGHVLVYGDEKRTRRTSRRAATWAIRRKRRRTRRASKTAPTRLRGSMKRSTTQVVDLFLFR
jgi:hypothetical protein